MIPVPPTAIRLPTSTPSATSSPTSSPTSIPGPTPTPIKITGFVKFSSYWPPLGGVNCAYEVNGECMSRMASLLPWQHWVRKAAACPPEWPFGTLVVIDDRPWVCLDRGGWIRYDPRSGIPWIDLLTDENLGYNYGQAIPATIIFPLNMEDQIQCEDTSWQFCSYSGPPLP